MIANRYVTSNGRVVRENSMVGYLALVSHMGVTQEKVVVADSGGAFWSGSAMDGYVFTEGVVVADKELSLLALVFEILCAAAECCKGVSGAALANDGVLRNSDVAVKMGVSTQDHVISNHAVGTDFAIGANFRFWRDDSSGMNLHKELR